MFKTLRVLKDNMVSQQNQEQDEGVHFDPCYSILYSNTSHPDWKWRYKTNLFVDDILLYMKNLKQSTKELVLTNLVGSQNTR